MTMIGQNLIHNLEEIISQLQRFLISTPSSLRYRSFMQKLDDKKLLTPCSASHAAWPRPPLLSRAHYIRIYIVHVLLELGSSTHQHSNHPRRSATHILLYLDALKSYKKQKWDAFLLMWLIILSRDLVLLTNFDRRGQSERRLTSVCAYTDAHKPRERSGAGPKV